MADTTTKRHRDTTVDTQSEPPKRHKTSYLNEQQETTTQELLDFFTSLSPDPVLDFIQPEQPDPDANNELTTHDDDKESVIRHLLEASDDELGIPSRVDDSGDVSGGGDDVSGGDDDVSGGGGGGNGYGDFWLWELEDEAANYYTLLQSELFMQ